MNLHYFISGEVFVSHIPCFAGFFGITSATCWQEWWDGPGACWWALRYSPAPCGGSARLGTTRQNGWTSVSCGGGLWTSLCFIPNVTIICSKASPLKPQGWVYTSFIHKGHRFSITSSIKSIHTSHSHYLYNTDYFLLSIWTLWASLSPGLLLAHGLGSGYSLFVLFICADVVYLRSIGIYALWFL